MSFELPKLGFDYKDLEPHIDVRTMEIHHSKHHAGYVTKLNAALNGNDDLLSMSVEELLKNSDKFPADQKQAIINNAGGHANHSLFWEILSPKGGGKPAGELLKAINNKFSKFEEFKKQFSVKAGSLFGSGWVFLIINQNDELEIKRHSFQNSPYLNNNIPILAIDVWEHAYYLKYQNRRPEYIESFWNLVNWEKVSELYSSFLKSSLEDL